jgi:hypothetical protein
VVVIKNNFVSPSPKQQEKWKSKSETAPDFARISAYFGWILAARKYTTLPKVFQGDIMPFYYKSPKACSGCHDNHLDL